MTDKFLYEILEANKMSGHLKEIPNIIHSGLSNHILLRDYQEEAFQYFITYVENKVLVKNKQIYTLFHMATGSGKTVIMAGLILYLYTKGYRNFLFFVNQTNILEKTKENFTKPKSSKYLFSENLEYAGKNIQIREVSNFADTHLNEDINICFTTTQKLHMDLFEPKENTITYEDFEDNKIVFISDESHHVNTMTRMNKDEKEAKRSWEYSVMNAFARNKDHVLLEFTATANLNDKNVKSKYKDKLIYDYELSKFRKSGYTKEFENFATDSSIWNRALMAIIISEYRKYLFADNGENIKPVIMLKSQKIDDSEDFYEEFYYKLGKISKEEIEQLKTTNISILQKALHYFEEKDSSFELLINSLQDGFSKDKAIIMNGSTDNTTEKQLLVNSLEDQDNPIRIIFAVDMLNEGWDVLNLFDIVRLYDTRQGSGKAGTVGAYTIREAQLIGRGARYCPFQVDKMQERFKRKYDHDLYNENRILETMYFHSRNDSRYIAELRQALVQTGMEDPVPIKLTYKLKDSFKETSLYKKGYVFSNKRLPKGRESITGVEVSLKNKIYTYTIRSVQGTVVKLFEDSKSTEFDLQNIKSIKFKNIDYNILSGAANCFKELKFLVLKAKYPALKTQREFLTSDNYLGNNTLELKSYEEEITGRHIFNGLIRAFGKVASYVMSIKQEFEGSEEFYPRAIRDTFKDKTVRLSSIDSNGGRGVSQNENYNELLKLDLSNEDWYAYNDNYGTDQEKLAMKYFKFGIEPKLKEKDLNYYVLRNERIPELAIYSFEDGERFEPDFFIFIEKKQLNKLSNYQVYLEPKGSYLLTEDQWKEEFLMKIGNKANTNTTILTVNHDYIVLGLPFFNSIERMEEIENAIDSWIGGV